LRCVGAVVNADEPIPNSELATRSVEFSSARDYQTRRIFWHAKRGAILSYRKEPERAISTICCGFWTATIYRQLRSVKKYFRLMRQAHDFR
jgi:hypothetical protein